MQTSPNPVKSFLRICLGAGMLVLLLAAAPLATAEDGQLRQVSLQQLLGADYAQAKVVGLDENGAERVALVAARLSGGKPVTIASWPKKDFRSGRTRWSVDGRQIIGAVNGECWTYGDPK